jgi:hypothetical protein
MTEKEVDHILAMLLKMCGDDTRKAHRAVIELVAENPASYIQCSAWLMREHKRLIGKRYSRSQRRTVRIKMDRSWGAESVNRYMWVPETAAIIPSRSAYGYIADPCGYLNHERKFRFDDAFGFQYAGNAPAGFNSYRQSGVFELFPTLTHSDVVCSNQFGFEESGESLILRAVFRCLICRNDCFRFMDRTWKAVNSVCCEQKGALHYQVTATEWPGAHKRDAISPSDNWYTDDFQMFLYHLISFELSSHGWDDSAVRNACVVFSNASKRICIFYHNLSMGKGRQRFNFRFMHNDYLLMFVKLWNRYCSTTSLRLSLILETKENNLTVARDIESEVPERISREQKIYSFLM